ncbi:MAG: PD40 domain-containing protein [Acidobacteria bacterium]|nr:PD40 domain-containing protein [Acidobacteriota bacterium]
MKRTLLFISIIALLGVGVFQLVLVPTRAQQSVTDEVTIIPLPIATNFIGTDVRGVSSDGKRIVFDSINNYNGNNVDSNVEIYVYDVDSRSVIQITDTKNLTDPADSTKITLNVNNYSPAISGDGTKIAFVSNASLGGTTNDDGNFEIYLADLPLGSSNFTVKRITNTDKNYDAEFVKEILSNYTPTLNNDGSIISFVSTRTVFKTIPGVSAQFTALKEGPSNAEPDGNGEIFLYRTATQQYSQVTVSRDVDATSNFVVRGFNSNPVLSGNGQSLVFFSGFNYPGAAANKNADFNGELFLYKVGEATNSFTQITETDGINNIPVVPIGGSVNIFPYGTRPISFDGTKLVFESSGNLENKNSDKTREVYLADLSGAKPVIKQITDQPGTDLTRVDLNFLPSINSTGTVITIGSTLNLTPASTSSVTADNADGSREVFRYDIATAKFRQLTFTPLSDLVQDQREANINSFPDNTGRLITFSTAGYLVAPSLPTTFELFQAYIRPVTATNSQEVKLSNAASFDMTQIARGSLVAAFGTQLANATGSAASANIPFELNGVSVSVAGIAARLIYVSPGQINFVLPLGVANGDTVSFTVNNNGIQSAGKVKIVNAAPGVFTVSSDGKGPAAAQCGRISPDGLSFLLTAPPCAVGNESQANILVIYGTGWRNSTSIQVKIGDQTLTPSFAGAQPDFPGLDQINVTLVKDLAAKTAQDIVVSIVSTTNIDSNKSQASFTAFENALTFINAAGFDVGTVARGSLVGAQGTDLAAAAVTAATTDLPFQLGGVTVTAAGVAARISSVSPTKVDFVMPNETKVADFVEVVVNNGGKISRGRVKVLDASPALFTTTNDGAGRAQASCVIKNPNGTVQLSSPPCSAGTDASPRYIRLTGTGWRNATKISVKIGDVDLTDVTFSQQAPNNGIDQIEAKLASSLAGKTDVDIVVTVTVGTVAYVSKTGIKVSFSQ